MKLMFQYFAEIFQCSFYPPFYRSAVRRSAFRAFGYYLFFTTVYSLAIGIAGFWWTSQNWDPTMNLVRENLPQFQIGISQGHVVTTLPDPFFWGDSSFSIIVDASGREHDLTPFNSLILVTKTRAIFKKNQFETREYNLSAIPDFSITSDDAMEWLNQHKHTILWSVFGTIGLGLLPLVWLFLIPPMLIFALLLLIPAKIIRSRLDYPQLLSITFYAVTLPTLLQTFQITRGESLGSWYWGVYLIWSLIAILVAREPDAPIAADSGGSTQGMPPRQG